MELLEPFRATAVILQESVKILPKNGKLIALILVPSVVLYSLFFLLFSFSYKSLFRDMLMRESFIPLSSPGSEEFTNALARLKEDVGLMFVVEVIVLLAYWIISLLSVTASVSVSAITNSGGSGNLSCKEFALMVIRACKRSLITGFYTTLLGSGYFFFVLTMAAPLFMFSDFGLGYVPSSIIWYAVFAYLLYVYLSVVWILSIVVSVIEENTYGLEALGKASGLIKGKRAQGFILSAAFVVLSVIMFQGFRIIRGHNWLKNDVLFGLFSVNLSFMIKLFEFVGYTILYFHCKKHHENNPYNKFSQRRKQRAQPSLRLFGILKEAFKVSIRNGRPLLFILFILFSSQAMIRYANTRIFLPIAKDFVAKSQNLPKNETMFDADPALFQAFLKDMRHIFAYAFVALSFLCLVVVFSAAASVHSTFEAYTAKVLSLKEMLSGTRGRWKRGLKTSIWMILIGAASAALFFFMFGIAGVMAEGSALNILVSIVMILGYHNLFYLCSLWMFSLVISVIEDELSGLKAISEATQLMRGKGMQGIVLTVLLMLLRGAIPGVFSFLQSTAPATENAKLTVVIDLAISIPESLAFCMWILFAFVVYTLFYHECKVRKTAASYDPIAVVGDL
ncbi:OLC1v1035357C1 [Oldenlandia corymbosa var. corymbosa]|uniref:OLC1v1035357C1 n=1 Tax=Oldenlandia corymbosa var. corymbosa TaxID=529605 RepID=A0AAV1CW17_OLDCO|nr:OLC1v1035357C1 [Oldenlandia corymbosa var. corymbosa]